MTELNPFEIIKQRKLMAELTANYAEAKRREARFTQTKYGFYDDDGVRQDGLIAFVRYFWDVLEPETAFVDGWPLWSIVEHLEAVTRGDIHRLLINVPPGFCKALDHDTPVLTTWGWKRHGDVVAGDFVFGADGQPKRVLGCTPESIEPTYEVEFDDGTIIRASAGHLWEIERDVMSVAPKYRRGRKKMVVTTLELNTAIDRGSWSNRPDRIALAEPISLPPKRLLIDPYVLGCWLGDGGSGGGIIYAGEQDAPHFSTLGRVATILPPGGTRKQAFYHIVVEDLSKNLRILGILGNKHIPDDYLEASVEQRWALLQGLMDTDGTCTPEGFCSFSNKSILLAGAVRRLAWSLGLKPGFTSHRAKLNGVDYGEHYLVGFTPPSGAKIFRLERKQALVRGNQNARSRYRYVSSIRLVEDRAVKCLHVEGQIYLAGYALVPTHNSLLTDVYWPAWEWGPMNLSHYRYVTFSYSQLLTMRDNDRFRTLITSPKYQALYGVSTTTHYGKREVRNGIAMRNTQVIKVMNQNTGWKLASSTGGVTLGERGDRIIIDDPHNMLEAESDIERTKVIKWFRESVSSRLNDLDKGAIVIIMQRLHEDDVSGVALGEDFDYCHLMIPWEFDPGRAFDDSGKLIENPIGWIDPRADPDHEDANAGEPAWLERFSAVAIARMRSEMGPYAWASQMEQSPTPRGTGVFQPEWWKLYEHPNNFFPEFSFTVASLDGAFTQDETNDPSALTLWGVFDTGDGKRGVMLIGAWAKHLQFSSKRAEKKPMELHGLWRQRTMKDWGLMEWVYDSCTWLYGKPFKVDRLLIEDKGPGHSAAQELRNRYGIHDFGIQLVKTRGDKMARALAVQPIFSNGLVWAPKYDWSEIVIRQMSKFPYDRHDDLTDSAVQCLRYLRDAGLLESDEERHYGDYERSQARPRLKSLYPV